MRCLKYVHCIHMSGILGIERATPERLVPLRNEKETQFQKRLEQKRVRRERKNRLSSAASPASRSPNSIDVRVASHIHTHIRGIRRRGSRRRCDSLRRPANERGFLCAPDFSSPRMIRRGCNELSAAVFAVAHLTQLKRCHVRPGRRSAVRNTGRPLAVFASRETLHVLRHVIIYLMASRVTQDEFPAHPQFMPRQ